MASLTKSTVLADISLAQYSRWRIGGQARLLVEPSSPEALRLCINRLHEEAMPVAVIGDGSNILFDDDGFDGAIIRVGRSLSRVAVNGTLVSAQAGIWVPKFIRTLGSAGLSGAEHAVGIPGTLGGLIIMNGGSQRKSISDYLTLVRGCTFKGEPLEFTRDECAFRYRGSLLQDRSDIVLEAEFTFCRDTPEGIRRRMLDILKSRRAKFPKRLPNCGSVFLSDPAMYDTAGPPGRAIEAAGLKGCRRGGAQVSPMHANFIVNLGGASSRDVLELIRVVRTAVYERTGHWLQCEVRHVAPGGLVRPAHVAADELAHRDR